MMGGVVRGGIGLIEEPLAAVLLDWILYAILSDSGSGASRQRSGCLYQQLLNYTLLLSDPRLW
jgi:hypothetical protein